MTLISGSASDIALFADHDASPTGDRHDMTMKMKEIARIPRVSLGEGLQGESKQPPMGTAILLSNPTSETAIRVCIWILNIPWIRRQCKVPSRRAIQRCRHKNKPRMRKQLLNPSNHNIAEAGILNLGQARVLLPPEDWPTSRNARQLGYAS